MAVMDFISCSEHCQCNYTLLLYKLTMYFAKCWCYVFEGCTVAACVVCGRLDYSEGVASRTVIRCTRRRVLQQRSEEERYMAEGGQFAELHRRPTVQCGRSGQEVERSSRTVYVVLLHEQFKSYTIQLQHCTGRGVRRNFH